MTLSSLITLITIAFSMLRSVLEYNFGSNLRNLLQNYQGVKSKKKVKLIWFYWHLPNIHNFLRVVNVEMFAGNDVFLHIFRLVVK